MVDLVTVATLLVAGLGAVGFGLYGLRGVLEHYRDHEPDGEAIDARADWLATPLRRALSALGKTTAAVVTRLPPFLFVRKRIWKGITLFALNAYRKTADADAVGFETADQSGRVELTPLKWFDGLEGDDREPGWAVAGRDRTYQPSKHDVQARLGKTPIIPVNRDEIRVGSLFESTVREAIDQGRKRPLYDVGAATLEADVTVHGLGNGGAAVADGGTPQWTRDSFEFEPRTTPIFKDKLIDISSGEGFDGQAISIAKYSTDAQSTTPEVVDQAEKRGEIAARLGMDQQDVKRLLLIAGGIAALLVAATHLPEILEFFAGGSGGGSGGSSSGGGLGLMLGWW